MNLERYLASRKRRVDAAIERVLPEPDETTGSVVDAMRYAVLGPGKRLRSIVTLAAHEACGGRPGTIDEPAAAMELIHTYSLVHDDLPAMDDDDLRRGRPTTHRVYGEARAVLAGDALLTLAFEVLADFPRGSDRAGERLEALRAAARGSGIRGMVGGQSADFDAQRKPIDADRLVWIHRHKTGALFAAAAEIGAIHARVELQVREALAAYGEALGSAFQITDDILDCTSTSKVLGKTAGKDRRAGKATYPAAFGVERSRRRADELVAAALERLRPLDLATPALEALARHAVARKR